MTFRKAYFFLTTLLFVTEVLIAAFVDDKFIRPYFGDFLVVILIYCLVMAFFRTSAMGAAIGVLFFSFFIELTQYCNLIGRLDLENSKVARAILGWSFSWADLAAYTMGILVVVIIERYRRR
jgi:hypothetical protein